MAQQAMLTREALEKCVRGYKHQKASYFKLPEQLKPKQIPAAIRQYASRVKAEDVVALMDTTLFDNGKDGFLMTETHMYGKEFNGKTIDLNRMERLRKDGSYLVVGYPDGSEDRLFATIFTDDLFELLGMVMDESTRLQKELEEKLAQQAAQAQQEPEPIDFDRFLAGGIRGLSEEKQERTPDEQSRKTSDQPPEEEMVEDIAPIPVERATEEKPQEDPEALFKAGTAAFMKKDYAAAREYFRKAAALGHGKAAQFLRQLEGMKGH